MLKINTLISSLVFALLSLSANAEVKLATMEKETAVTAENLLGTNENNLGLKAGSQVADFSINTYDGKPSSLKQLLENSEILVVFYRGGWCPYCNFQIRQLAQNFAEFKKRGVTPVLISVDKPDAAALVKNAYDIPFPVLSDPELAAHEAFDVVLYPDAEMIERYKKFGINLKEWSGKDHNKIAITSAFLVDKSATVKWAHVSKDFRTRPSPEQFLNAIDNNK